MSFYYKIALGVVAALTLSAPSFADGTPGQRVNRGPAPVQAHAPTPPEPGCFLIEGGKAWSCPARTQHQVRTTTAHNPTPSPCAVNPHTGKPCNAVTRRVVKQHPPVVTKRSVTHRTAAPQRTVTHRSTVRRAETRRSNEVTLDMASFSGGVGNGVDGGYYGGGGAVLISSGRSYSGVLSHSASSYTFRSGRRGGKRRGGGGGCGCMGGGMGGGD